MRWREGGAGNRLNEGVKVQSSDADITVSDYGNWVVRVEACNDAGCGPVRTKGFTVQPSPESTPEPTVEPTPEPTIEPTPEPARPARPTGLSVSTQPGSLDVSVDWDDVTGADSYKALWRPAGLSNSLNKSAKSKSSEIDITVADYGIWLVSVEACNSAGCGAGESRAFKVNPPKPKQETASSTDPTPPKSPRGLAATQPTPGQVTLTWTAPKDDGGYPITGYEIYRSYWQPGGTVGVVSRRGHRQHLHHLCRHHVSERTPYTYRVRAINSAGVGDSSQREDNNRASDGWCPILAAGPDSRREHCRRGDSDLDRAPRRWRPSNHRVRNIQRILGARTELLRILVENTATTSTTYLDTTVAGADPIHLLGQRNQQRGCGQHCKIRHNTMRRTHGVPFSPQNLAAVENTVGEVTLTWTAPQDDGGYPITGYKIYRGYWAPERVIEVLVEDTATTSTTYVDTTVEERTRYTYWVRAINSAGVGNFTNLDMTTKRQKDGVPYWPRNLTAVEETAGEVTLTWTAPEDDGGYPITRYKIYRGHWTPERVIEVLVEDTAATSTTYVDTTVEERTWYTYWVSAINSAGEGDATNLDITTKGPEGVPGAPGE